MITPQQIKAARALLDWDQDALAARAGLSKTGLANIESGKNRPTPKTLEGIRQAIWDAGVEFIDAGVRERDDKIQLYEGEEAITKLLDDIIVTLRDVPKNLRDLFIFGVDEKVFSQRYPSDRLQDHIEQRKYYSINQKILICEGDKNFVDSPLVYRYVPKKYFSTTPTYVYHDKVATALFGSFKTEVIIIHDALFANERRKIFDFVWDSSKQPPAAIDRK